MPGKGRRSNGEGTVRERPNGTFEMRITALDATGRKHRISVYGRSKREVMQKAKALQVQEAAGQLAAPNQYTVETFLDAWLDHHRPKLKEKTAHSYEYLIDDHIIPRLGHLRLTGLTPLHVEQMQEAMLTKGLSPRTTAYCRAILRRALQQAVRWGLVARNVAQDVEPPRQAPRRLEVWTPEEARRFLEVAEPHKLYPLFYLALITGLRRGELLGLRWQDVDLASGRIDIVQNLVMVGNKPVLQTPKTAHSARTIYIGPDAAGVLVRQREQQAAWQEKAGNGWLNSGLIFTGEDGGPLGTTAVNKPWKALKEQAGVTSIRFHDLRHTYASLAMLRGLQPKTISERLGHSNVAFTLHTYAHVYDQQRKAAALDLDNLLDGVGS